MGTDAADLPRNPARAVSRTGSVLGLFLAIGAAAQGSGSGLSLAGDLPWIAVFAGCAVAFVLVGAILLDRAFLGAGMDREIARGNVAAGLVAASHRTAVAVVASRCFYGADLRLLGIAGVFAALGVVTLLVFQTLHRRLTHYADDQEVRGENIAAALSSAGLILALSVIVGHAAEGTFRGWGLSLRGYLLALALACGLYPVRQVLVSRVILGLPLGLRSRALDRAIMSERNGAFGAIEGLAYLATALLVTGIW